MTRWIRGLHCDEYRTGTALTSADSSHERLVERRVTVTVQCGAVADGQPWRSWAAQDAPARTDAEEAHRSTAHYTPPLFHAIGRERPSNNLMAGQARPSRGTRLGVRDGVSMCVCVCVCTQEPFAHISFGCFAPPSPPPLTRPSADRAKDKAHTLATWSSPRSDQGTGQTHLSSLLLTAGG